MSIPPQYIEELKFYLEICRLVKKAEANHIRSCIPTVSNTRKFTAQSLYDVSLIASNISKIIPNDTYFTEKESFFFLVGANGGGKTTYLRAVGINLILFLAGCPIFAHSAEIYPFSAVFTHFPSDERFDGMGRLDEEQKRTEAILQQADTDAFLLFNETFSGTAEEKGYSLLLDTVKTCEKQAQFGLYVTHFHNVNETDYPILQAEINPADENLRTYRILPKNSGTSSYAEDILKKYKLDKTSLWERRKQNGI